MSEKPYYVRFLETIKSSDWSKAIKVRDWIRQCRDAREQGKPVVGYHDFMKREEKPR